MRCSIRPLLLVLLAAFSPTVAIDARAEGRCERIVSLAPSLTETAFALGLGQNVVGVTRFDRYPGEVRSIPNVGGLLDPSYEAILALRPSIVLLLEDHRSKIRDLSSLGLSIEVFDHSGVEGIMESIGRLASTCGRPEAGDIELEKARRAIDAVKRRARGRPAIRALVVIGSARAGGELGNIYVSGGDGFYADLIKLAGGDTIYKGQTMSFSSLSPESLMALDPEVIVEIVPVEEGDIAPAGMDKSWQRFDMVRAVRERRIHVLHDDYLYIPGPRFTRALDRLSAILHPEGAR